MSPGATDALSEYRRRRDLSRTDEPKGGPAAADPGGTPPSFVVQIHDATAMHFDFRLEVDGVLKSWAVPKEPSADPHDKRLAMPTEDHPLEYRDFEGLIAPGEYPSPTPWSAVTPRSGWTGASCTAATRSPGSAAAAKGTGRPGCSSSTPTGVPARPAPPIRVAPARRAAAAPSVR